MHLVAEFATPKHAFLAKTEEPGQGHETPRPCSVRGPSCAGNPHHPGSSECGPSFEHGRSPKEPDRRCSVGHTSQADEAPATVKRSVLQSRRSLGPFRPTHFGSDGA